jgi:hypothetical protein
MESFMDKARIFFAGLTASAILILLTIPSAVIAGDGKPYGKPLSGSDTIKISVLMADPDTYVGKTVRTEGLITGVCEKRGCWMSLATDKKFPELRIKVDDGVMIFPIEAKGKRAIAEGEFARIEMTLEQTLAYKKHHAEEQNEEFDPETVTEPLTYYQINATGAVIR